MQIEARTQVADVLAAESGHIDPALRIIGLDSIANDADPAVADVVAVLIAQVRLLEKLGEPEAALAKGYERIGTEEDQRRRAFLEQQLVGAVVERLRRDHA